MTPGAPSSVLHYVKFLIGLQLISVLTFLVLALKIEAIALLFPTAAREKFFFFFGQFGLTASSPHHTCGSTCSPSSSPRGFVCYLGTTQPLFQWNLRAITHCIQALILY
ncbi:hypothetical protein F5Y08DRAFT_248818 [Xylaria arbuscula]|nr:hypothetical protein F5Y08DRAFT_248818 [Xylaria arbuscula]